MYRTDNKDIWRVFREHHYLSAEMNKASECYTIYWNDVLIGFRCYLAMPNGSIKYAWRGSRLVILPDYQNLGIGTAVLEFLGEYYLSHGYKYFDRSSHLRLGRHWENSPKWVASSTNKKISKSGSIDHEIKYKNYDKKRICYSYEYLGKDYAEKEHLYIHIDDNPNINYDILKQDLIKLKEKYWLCIITGEIKTPSRIEDICLELGIRTQLLYTTKKGVATMSSKYKNKKIITTWDKAFSDKVRRYYKI